MFQAFDALLAVDIGGTNIRAGVVRLNRKGSRDLSKAKVWKFSLWRHGDEEGVKRDQAITQLGAMLNGLIGAVEKKRLKLAPFIGIGCPGFIEQDGSIDRGAQNLPGNWESSRFNLPVALHDMIPTIGEHETSIVLHNDAVVQGLSEIPFMQDVAHWGILQSERDWATRDSLTAMPRGLVVSVSTSGGTASRNCAAFMFMLLHARQSTRMHRNRPRGSTDRPRNLPCHRSTIAAQA